MLSNRSIEYRLHREALHPVAITNLISVGGREKSCLVVTADSVTAIIEKIFVVRRNMLKMDTNKTLLFFERAKRVCSQNKDEREKHDHRDRELCSAAHGEYYLKVYDYRVEYASDGHDTARSLTSSWIVTPFST